jgi:hypothetical protein
MTARLADQSFHGVSRWVLTCDRCGAIWSCIITSEDDCGATIDQAVGALARLQGWTFARAGSVLGYVAASFVKDDRARCPRCSRQHAP